MLDSEGQAFGQPSFTVLDLLDFADATTIPTKLSTTESLVLRRLIRRLTFGKRGLIVDARQHIFDSREQFAEALGISQKCNVSRALTALEAKGLITVERVKNEVKRRLSDSFLDNAAKMRSISADTPDTRQGCPGVSDLIPTDMSGGISSDTPGVSALIPLSKIEELDGGLDSPRVGGNTRLGESHPPIVDWSIVDEAKRWESHCLGKSNHVAINGIMAEFAHRVGKPALADYVTWFQQTHIPKHFHPTPKNLKLTFETWETEIYDKKAH